MSRFSRPLGLAALPAVLLLTAAAWPHRAGPAPHPGAGVPAPVDTALLNTFKWRNLGPERGGRSIAVAGVRGQPDVAYFGATGGGLWKTTNGGQDWAPVTDHQVTSASVGAVGVSETDPNEVIIGMGECEIRGDIMPGDGMYRSTDAGKTWTHVGFNDVDAICKVRIDPTNANTVYAAVFGKYAVPSPERGIFKSTDGGVTWKKILFRNDSTGGITLVIDHNHPQVLYAALWQAYRKEYTASSGGAGSGLFKSTDGGEHWTEITHNKGLPSGIDGKIGVAVSPANSNRVYALVENEAGGLYRSDDAGATWTLVNDDHNIRQRAFYYTHVYADYKDQDLVYMQNTSLFKSTDGGKTLTSLRGTHGDFHDLWIDPDNSQHLVVGNDGGGAVSTDGGKTWTDQDYSTAQLYHVAATVGYPYDVCGAQQDDGTVCVSSMANLQQGGRGFGGFGRGGGSSSETYSAGGSEPGYIAPDPLDPDIFFTGANNGGFMTRLNRRTGQEREVNPYPLMFSGEPSSALVERWQWTYPIIFSPVDPHLLFTSSQHLWKTTDNGQNWTRISPDLTRHDPSTMGPSGGPITHDMNAPEVYATIFAIGPSKKDVNVIWTGSDDGLVYVTRDGGASWTNVTPPGMPDFGRVSQIDASAFDGGAAYVAVKRPLLDDQSPYIFRTHDYGKTWTRTVNGIRADDYVHAVREDPSRAGMLFAATQHGVYMSYDDGDHWSSLSLNLPDVPVTDLIVYRHDLVISTHGRGFYILNNIEPLEQYSPAVESASAYLFAPPPAIRSTTGAEITYWLKQPATRATLEILDASGQVIRTYKPDTAQNGRGGRGGGFGRFRFGGGAPPVTAGVNHFNWDLAYESATSFPGMILWGATTRGPAAAPGNYTVRLIVDGQTLSQPLTVKRNPLFTDVTDADLQAQFDLAIKIRDKLSEANQAVIDVRNVKAQVDDRLQKSGDGTLKRLGAKLTTDAGAIEENIYQTRNQSGQDPLNFPIKINNRIGTLLSTVSDGDGAPIGNAVPIFNYLSGKLKVQTDALAQVWATDLAAFNAQARKLGLPPVNPKCAQGEVCGIVP
ncbi:MAG TPA: glycosyl hydrolase [Gemmatimonadaceae bacterium]|nr:glycosyl hydrolase [Gemmatimonadaceae bacterium]